MSWYDFLRPKKNPFTLDPSRGQFCGWKKIRLGLEQSRAMLPDITSTAKTIAKVIAKVVKVVGWALGAKYGHYISVVGEAINLQVVLGTRIVKGEITPEEAGVELDKWLVNKGVDSSTIRNLVHIIAKIITTKLEEN